jgi:hypothetical protein
VSDRTFTPAEANSALAQVRPAAERMVSLRERLRELERNRRELVQTIAGNGSGFAVNDARREDFDALLEELEAAVEELEALGIVVKDADLGLVDFPARRHGEDVLLCWHVGEERVAFWHGLEEGYAGRKPVDWGERAVE